MSILLIVFYLIKFTSYDYSPYNKTRNTIIREGRQESCTTTDHLP